MLFEKNNHIELMIWESYLSILHFCALNLFRILVVNAGPLFTSSISHLHGWRALQSKCTSWRAWCEGVIKSRRKSHPKWFYGKSPPTEYPSIQNGMYAEIAMGVDDICHVSLIA